MPDLPLARVSGDYIGEQYCVLRNDGRWELLSDSSGTPLPSMGWHHYRAQNLRYPAARCCPYCRIGVNLILDSVLYRETQFICGFYCGNSS